MRRHNRYKIRRCPFYGTRYCSRRKRRRWKNYIMRNADPVSLRKEKGPVLAVDADANSNLNEVLGVEVDTTLGDVREEIAHAEMTEKSPIPKGMSKADYAEVRFEDALAEEDDYDLLVMGRTQGKGCYCFVNGLLQAQLAKYQKNYPYIVVDNEAGWNISAEESFRAWRQQSL